jgi:NADPH:quinone reductase-like Zn-dependent oxidoreductase
MDLIESPTFGDPSVLQLAEAPAPAIDEKTALVRVIAASINPSDVKNVAGATKQTTLPRIPGRDYLGVVEAGPAEWIGAEVWGTGGDAGFTRDGAHAELIAVPVGSLRRKPGQLSFDQAASAARPRRSLDVFAPASSALTGARRARTRLSAPSRRR